MKYQYILLDWDGCLAKTLDLWLDIYKEIPTKKGIVLSHMTDRQIVMAAFGKWAKGFKNLGVVDHEAAYKEATKLIVERSHTVDLYPFAKEILIDLRIRNLSLALVTSSYKDWITPALEYHGLEKFFDLILAKDDVVNGKPDPEIVEKSLLKLGGSVGKAIIIGDSDNDIKAGKNAGIATCLFYPKSNEKYYSKEFLTKVKPNYIIRSLREILKVI